MLEDDVVIATGDGAMEAFFVTPERGGPHPAILFYMDAPGIREELRDMARRLASVGYAVLQPNLYYRHGPGVKLDQAALRVEGGPERQRMFALMDSLSIARVMADTKAMLCFLDTQAEVRAGKVGAVGYCMSGPFVFAAATHEPDRIAAAASIYGVKLCTDAEDSPHRGAAQVKGELYFAVAETDAWAPPEMVEALRKALAKAGARHEVELYPKTHHGFAFPLRAGVYDKSAAERHWERLFALFARNLKP